MRARVLATLLGVAVLAAGCTHSAGSGGQLTGALVSPTDVALSWAPGDPSAAGHTVEYANTPDGPFTILDFVPAGRTSYTHPSLMPRTTFYYRTRPYYGPVSNVVTVTLPLGGQADTGNGQPDWAAPGKRPEAAVTGTPGGAPTGLTARVHDPTGILLTWTDRASDETGYLLEVRPSGSATFAVVDVLDPDVNAVGYVVTDPNGRTAAYRVRAFRYGPPSNVVEETTGTG